MKKFFKFYSKQDKMTIGNISKLLLVTLLKIISFIFGFGVLCFFILEFLVFDGSNSGKNLLENYTLLISLVVAISSYLMAKVIEKFCSIYNSEKQFIPAVVSLVVNNPIKILILVISLTWFSITQYRNFTGYCHKEGRYLTEQELIDRVIEKDFVITDELERERRLNKICINYGPEDEEFTKELPERKCGKITYKSKKEFIQKTKFRGYEDCYSDRNELFKESQLEKCSDNRFYYSSAQEFYEKNLDCCKLTKHPWSNSSFENFVNSFFGTYLYGLEILGKDHPFNKKEPYGQHFYSVRSCGDGHWIAGMHLTEKEYINEIGYAKKEKIKQSLSNK